jgi:hypothetical protein
LDRRYEAYCLVDSLFYDSPHSGGTGNRDFKITERGLPAGWREVNQSEWYICVPPASSLPAQGWKIHISACQDNAERLLDIVWDYCIPRRVSFKFLRSPVALLMRNSKYASRGSSGKLVTVYPVDNVDCGRLLTDLNERLEGEPGPYILSDLRYGAGPLHVRYGGFSRRLCLDSAGELVPAIADPSGKLVPDLRTPVFTPPAWVDLPSFLIPHREARDAVSTVELPYRFERALHFSNGGGVYAGVDTRSGDKVVLKEARPYAGLSADGADAVSRLRRERDILGRLGATSAVPRVHDYFELGEHHFLVQEFVEGTTLNSCYASRYPLIGAPDPAAVAEYTAWALRVCSGTERATDAIHELGVVVNDLHMFNIIVREDETVRLIDFEAAAYLEEGKRPVIGNPGFVAPRGRSGFAIDRYSLACLRLAIFMPLTTLLPLDPDKAVHLADVIRRHFPVPSEFLAEAVAEITGPTASGTASAANRAGQGHGRGDVRRSARPAAPGAPAGNGAVISRSIPTDQGPGAGAPTRTTGETAGGWPWLSPDQRDWARAKHAMVDAILASATPDRDDRLFPGDIEQFAAPGGGLGLAYGAAGVIYALAEAAGVRLAAHEQWLLAKAANPPSGVPLGLYDGLLGVAHVLQRLGHDDAAAHAASLFLGERWEKLGTGLYGGLAGAALALLDLADATADAALREAGLAAAEIVADRMAHWREGQGRPRAGLLHGASGPALLFVRMYERTGDASFLDLASDALAADLDRCVTDRKNSLQVDDGWRVLPYLDNGSVGIGLVLDEFLTHRGDARFAAAAQAIRGAACSQFYAQSGLLSGRAGMLFYLARRCQPGEAATDPDVAAHIGRLDWHAVHYGGGLAFPGNQVFRLSMDLGTGTAGVLLALAAALSTTRASLPFLPAVSQSGASRPTDTVHGERVPPDGKQNKFLQGGET